MQNSPTIELCEPLELVVKGKDKSVAWACGKCMRVVAGADRYNNEDARKIALEHCKPKKGQCKTCGIELAQEYYTKCSDCREKSIFENAEKIAFEDWDSNEPIFYGDEYYTDFDSFFSNWGLADREEWPSYVFASKEDHWGGIDLNRTLENELEEYQSDNYDPVVNDLESLQEFLKEWNKKQDIVVYWEDQKRIILTPPEVFEKYYGE